MVKAPSPTCDQLMALADALAAAAEEARQGAQPALARTLDSQLAGVRAELRQNAREKVLV